MATSKNQIRRLKKLIKLSYLQTVAIVDGQKSATDFVGNPQPFSQQLSSSTVPDFWFSFTSGVMGDGGGSRSVDFQDTGWQIARSWLETYWDKIRYSIGIRDIGIFQFNYVTVSEFVSYPWVSPKEVQKVILVVDEIIPIQFPAGPDYIEYYVSPEPGSSWYRINPLDQPTRYSSDGSIIPRIINFNSEEPANSDNENKYITTETPVTSVRLKCVFKRPTGIENSTSMTPVLKQYSILLYPKNGLSL